MIIDTHTHIFPDKIASKTVAYLESLLPDGLCAHTQATKDSLLSSMKEGGVDVSVVLPVITDPKQFDSINRFASELNGRDGLISFGGIHPDCDRIEEKLEIIKSLGLRGIKLHPDYQHCFIDDDRNVRIIRKCVELDLMVVIHAGVDVGFPDPVHCSPEASARMLDLVYEGKEPKKRNIIFAHIGGHDQYDEVLTCLVGKNVYFDLAFSADKLPAETLIHIIRTHGSEKILFATDSPWADQKQMVDYVSALPLFAEEKERIFWRNANEFLYT